MDDPLLAKARALVAAASSIPDVHSASASFSAAQQQQSPGSSPAPSPPRRSRGAADEGSVTKFRCSVFKGSSLVTVLSASGEGGDIRAVVQKGMLLDIDGREYQVSRKQFAEWTPNRFELEADYPGETNFDACLSVRNAVRRSPKKRGDAEPIPTSDIRSAISGLDAIADTFRHRHGRAEEASRPLRKAQASKAMNLTDKKRPMSDFGFDAEHEPASSSSAIIRSKTGGEKPPARPRSTTAIMSEPEPSSSYSSNRRFSAAGSDDGSSAMSGAGYLSHLAQAREVSMETQRKRAMQRVVQKIKDDEAQSLRSQKAADDVKEAHRRAMEIKAQQLREKTLQRVAQLHLRKAESEESKKKQETFELSKKLQSASIAQTETYKQRMLRMRKDTAKRLRQIGLEEEERDAAQQVLMNKKLSEIADARRRVDREAPVGYAPPVHTQVVRQARTASPKSSVRVSGNSARSPYAESRDDAPVVMHISPNRSNNVARAPSPVVVSSAQGNFRQEKNGTEYWGGGGEYRHVSSHAPAMHTGSRIPVPQRHAGSSRNDDDDDLSDDSLGQPPQAPSPKRVQVSASYDEDLSVLTFDSPSRPKGPLRPANMNVDGVPVRRPKKKVWKALKPLQIASYSAVPHVEALKET